MKSDQKFRVELDVREFKKALSAAGLLSGDKNTLSALGIVSITFSQEQQRAIFRSTNLALFAEIFIPATVQVEETFLVRVKVLSEIVSRLSRGTCSITQKENRLVIRSGKFEAKILLESDFQLPEQPNFSEEFGLTVPAGKFWKYLSSCLSITPDKTHANSLFNGVSIECGTDSLALVSTDGARVFTFCEFPCPVPEPCVGLKTVIDQNSLEKMYRVFGEMSSDEDEEVSLLFQVRKQNLQKPVFSGSIKGVRDDVASLVISSPSCRVSSPVFACEYIDWKKYRGLPGENGVALMQAELKEALGRAMAISDENHNKIEIMAGSEVARVEKDYEIENPDQSGTVYLLVNNVECGMSYEGIPASVQNDGIDLIVSAKLLSKIISQYQEMSVGISNNLTLEGKVTPLVRVHSPSQPEICHVVAGYAS